MENVIHYFINIPKCLRKNCMIMRLFKSEAKQGLIFNLTPSPNSNMNGGEMRSINPIDENGSFSFDGLRTCITFINNTIQYIHIMIHLYAYFNVKTSRSTSASVVNRFKIIFPLPVKWKSLIIKSSMFTKRIGCRIYL